MRTHLRQSTRRDGLHHAGARPDRQPHAHRLWWRAIRPALWAAWMPVWILYAGLMSAVHALPLDAAAWVATRFVVPAAVLGLGVDACVKRTPWPGRLSARFLVTHIVAASLYVLLLAGAVASLEWVFRGQPLLRPAWRLAAMALLGTWFYIMLASFAYTWEESRRAARAEAATARMQLDVLRGQLQPHLLFNALHTVVHLIPVAPKAAAAAAEQLGSLLSIAVSEDRDLVPLRDERAFVGQYLALEVLRFGERLRVEQRWGEGTDNVLVPTYAVQTLVENAIRHGASRRVQPTCIEIDAQCIGQALRIVVVDRADVGLAPHGIATSALVGSTSGHTSPGGGEPKDGTGLRRLRDRLALLAGSAGTLTLRVHDGHAIATLELPQDLEAE